MTTSTRRAAQTPTAPEFNMALPDGTWLFRAWQDGIAALAGSYGDQSRPTVTRIVESTRELTAAQMAVAGAWLRAPLWLTGMASPTDLQAGYARLFAANHELMRAYADTWLGWQRAQASGVERVVDSVGSAVERAVDTQVKATAAVSEMATNVVETARDVAADAEARAEQQREQAEQARRRAERAEERRVAEDQRLRTASRVIKGKTGHGGEKIYHLPGQSSYERTEADQFFAAEEEAQQAGFRRAQTPGGGTVKGVINREGERIYHLPDQANYDRIESPDMLFESEEQAQANGFRPSQR
jgi:hypothetical protein